MSLPPGYFAPAPAYDAISQALEGQTGRWPDRSRPISKHPALPYVAPFAAFMVFIALAHWLPVSPRLLYPVRVVVGRCGARIFSRQLISFRAGNWLGSIGVGIAVFVLWIAPDVLWPAYRSHWLLDNSLVGSARSSLPHEVKSDLVFLVFRIFGSVLLVPVLEELFWRGWLMRWLHPAGLRGRPARDLPHVTRSG